MSGEGDVGGVVRADKFCCGECYRGMLPSEKVCPSCMSNKVMASPGSHEDDAPCIVPSEKLIRENPDFGSMV